MPTTRIAEFDLWQPNYGGASVTVYKAGTTTKADIYTDEALSVVASNPQTLDTLSANGISYGKWTQSIYTQQAYELDIDSTDQTAIVRPPLTTLDGQDASDATVIPTGGTVATALDNILGRVVNAEDYGALGAVAATNTTTLTAAIAAASANSGGRVILPEGTFAFTTLSLSAGVVLEGEGRGVTTLTSTTAGNCITVAGDKAGLSRLTLDGLTNVASSVGLYAKAHDELVFNDVEIKRFVTGLHFKGGRRFKWDWVFVSACGTGVKFHGDNDAGGGADGDELRELIWNAGKVDLCTVTGIDFSYEDKPCRNNTVRGVFFESNTGTAVNINGARGTRLPETSWLGNTTDLAVDDDSLTTVLDNTVIGLTVGPGVMNGGAVTFTGTCQDVIFDTMEIEDVDITLTAPDNAILARDCTEDSSVTINTDGDKWTRWRSITRGISDGLTTDATVTKAWAIDLPPGSVCYLEAKVIGNQRNGESRGEYHISTSANRDGSTLDYDTQTANFTVGDVLTGGTSGATARIIADSDAGATGSLTLRDIVGTFQDDEIITDPSGGSADVNGTITHVNAALLGAVTALRAAREDVAGWDATFVANGTEIELRVTGAASTTIEWRCDVDATVS